MRRKLVNLGLLIVVGGSIFLKPPTTFGAAPGQAGNPLTPAGRAPLTNAEVIRMLQAIMTSIRSNPVKFDLSPAGVAALRQAGVSEKILLEMMERQRQANASGANSTNPGSQGSTPGKPSGKLTPQQVNAMLARVRSGKGTLSPVIGNPAATQANSALIGLLRQQKQTAVTERNQTPPGGGHPLSPNFSRASLTRAPLTTAAAAPRSSLASRALAPSATAAIAYGCPSTGPATVSRVSGQQGSGAVFTQDPAFNPFTIKGCHFGNGKGQAQLNYSNGRKLANLTVDTWTDNLITVEVDPSLVNALDQNNVSLVLFPASGPQVTRSGFRFYAMRREVLLTTIPAGQVYLTPINDDSGSPVTPKYSSPYQGMSGGVDRINSVRFVGGTDQFNFTKLKPGFVLEKYQVKELSAPSANTSCGIAVTDATNYTDGAWGWQMAGNTVRVSWQEAHSHSACDDESDASYGLNVWVVGPALSPGTSLWQ